MMEAMSSMSSTNYSASACWQDQTFDIVFIAQIIQYLITTIPNQTTLVISIKAQHRFGSKEVKNRAAFFEDTKCEVASHIGVVSYKQMDYYSGIHQAIYPKVACRVRPGILKELGCWWWVAITPRSTPLFSTLQME